MGGLGGEASLVSCPLRLRRGGPQVGGGSTFFVRFLMREEEYDRGGVRDNEALFFQEMIFFLGEFRGAK